MPYAFTDAGIALQQEVQQFLDDHIYPNEREYHEQVHEVGPTGYPPIMDKLKAAARERGLWNLFLPHLAPDAPGTKLSNLDYAPISEQLGKTHLRVGGAQLLRARHRQHGDPQPVRLGTDQAVLAGAAARGRDPLGVLHDRARFGLIGCHQRPAANRRATATSTCSTGRKWFSSGALAERCKVFIVMGKTDPNASAHLQQSMIVVPKDTPGDLHRS